MTLPPPASAIAAATLTDSNALMRIFMAGLSHRARHRDRSDPHATAIRALPWPDQDKLRYSAALDGTRWSDEDRWAAGGTERS